MALTRFTGSSNVISQLSNQPNDNEGLSAAQLKAKFDQYGETFKDFFNNTFLPEVESAISAAAAGITPSGFSGAIIIDGTIMTEKLSSTSGIQAVSTQTIRDAAVTKQKLSSEVQAILDDVSGKTVHSTVSVVLSADGWGEDNTQTATATGVTTNNTVIATAGVDDTSHEAWSNCDIRAIAQGTNTLTFKARTVPTSNVNVNILILA